MTDRELFEKALEALEALEEIRGGYSQNLVAALRERLAQPEQEPVATVQRVQDLFIGYLEKSLPVGTPLYAAPPQRKPLTDEMKKQMRESCDSHEMRGAFVDGWLSAEAAHGIKGEA